MNENASTSSSELSVNDNVGNDGNTSSEQTSNEKMPWPAFSEIFTFRPTFGKENNFAFSCKLCVGGKIIHANKSSSANLKKHIKAKHPQYLRNIEKTKSSLLKRRNEDMTDDCNTSKQPRLEKWGSGKFAITQSTMDKYILQFIIQDLQPLLIVDSPAFINLVRNGLPSSIRILCRKTAKAKLQQAFCEMKTTLINKLAEVEFVSTTADLWSKMKRSYLGVTVHWIDNTTLKRESAALVCRRIKGRHTYDILAKAINSIFLEYHIQNKVCCTTTDSRSNFVKAFRIFQKDDDNDDNDDESITEFHNLSDLLIMNEEEECNIESEDVITLPAHHRCVAHLLNLIAVKDSEMALKSSILYKKKYRTVFAKLTKLWNKQNQSTQVADKIKEICGVYLKTPVVTRWNSTFDCVSQLVNLLKHNPENINTCLDHCCLQRLTDNEVTFLEEYCQVMGPLARALDILQSENGMYMGYLLPILNTLEEKLKNLSAEGVITECHSLLTSIQEGLTKRFSTLYEKKELIIAACLHPKFKLNWLTGSKKKFAANYLQDLLGIQSNENSPDLTKQTVDPDNDFFDFRQKAQPDEEELQHFLKSNSTNIELLHNYSKLKKFFIKYNTPLPSSASVERLFSCGGFVLTPQRGHLNDDIMEQQLLLKINKKFWIRKIKEEYN